MGGCFIRINFAVTTSHRPDSAVVQEAKKLAGKLNVAYMERNDRSIKYITSTCHIEGMLVVSLKGVSYMSGTDEFFFHPGLTRLRILEIQNGKTDQMINAMSLGPGLSVLDCTLGLGTDAVVASYIVGPKGRVTGIEASPVISYLVKRGLASYPEKNEGISRAMRRVAVINAGHKEYLAGLAPRSYDVVYFDPMFRLPRRNSPAINAMRSIAFKDQVDRETIDFAVRAASRRVVLKERRGSAEFLRLGFEKIVGGHYAPLAYGIIERRGEL